MSYAPQSLLDIRDYLRTHTGLTLAALGIVGDAAHNGGYHCGRDRLVANDYSNRTARDRAGLTDAASALDIGDFSRLRALTAFLVAEARGGRLPDVRELIGPGADGRAYRWDHLAGWSAVQRPADDSHEWHLHISYYRDSEGRSKLAPFQRFFEPQEDEVDLTDENLDAIAGRVYAYFTEDVEAEYRAATEGTFPVGYTVRPRAALRESWAYGKENKALLAALTGQVSGLTALVQQLATMPAVPLTDDQLADLTAAVTQAAAGAAEEALERTRLVVDEG